MIRIERPPKAPDILQNSGEPETKINCELYDCHSDEYRSYSMKFKFKDHIYAHDSVRNALLETQSEKCCYCESKFRATSPGAVEHFRPKGAVRQERGGEREHPGYYWLAYRWENLLVSCQSCNQKKEILFPLSEPELRARSHRDDPNAERPLLVDPAGEEPRQHIRFRGSAIEALTKRGRETIRVLDLNRSALGEKRRGELVHLKCYQQIVKLRGKIDHELIEVAQRRLERAVRPDAEYSSMARCFLEPDSVRDDPR